MTKQTIKSIKQSFETELNARIAHETAIDENANVINVLLLASKKFDDSVFSYFAKHNLDFSFLNVARKADKRFNAKALDKVARVVKSISSKTDMLDNYTRAIVKNAIHLSDNHKIVELDNVLQRATCSHSIEHAQRAKLDRSACVDKNASTANTQQSSTRAALDALKLVTVKHRDTKSELTQFNVDVLRTMFAK